MANNNENDINNTEIHTEETAANNIESKKTPDPKQDNIKPPASKNNKKSAGQKKPKKKNTHLRVVEGTKISKKPSKKAKTISVPKSWVFVGLGLVLLFVIFIISKNSVVKIGEKQVMFSQEYTMSSKADFHVCGNNIYYVSKDGMILLNKQGETVWTDTFTMTSPDMLCDGEYAAVADNKSKIVNVYNLTGKLYSITAAGNITSFAVNPIGCCAVICKVNDDYKIDIYSDSGEQMFEGTYASSDGMPIAVDISDDGKLMAVSLINISEIKLKSNVMFYYTTKTEAQSTESSDGMISAVNCGEEITSVVRFLPDNSCIAATDSRIMNIGGDKKQTYTQNWEIPYTNYITAMDIVDNKYIAVAYGEPISAGTEAKPAYSICWYNTKGKEIGSAVTEESITKISSSLGASIAYMGKNFKAFTVKGKELWSYTALQNVESIQFYNSQDNIVLATATKMNLLDVKKGADMEEAAEVNSDEATDSEENAKSSEKEQEAQTEAVKTEAAAQPETAKAERTTAETTAAKEN